MKDLPWQPGSGLRGDLAEASAIDLDDDKDFTAEHVALVVPPVDPDASRHLKRLVANWAVLADLAFADLLLYVGLPSAGGAPHDADPQPLPDRQPGAAQHEPTLFSEDVVGRSMDAQQRPLVAQSMASGEISEGVVDSPWLGDNIRVTSIPVRFRGRTIAVVARESALSLDRDPANLERSTATCSTASPAWSPTASSPSPRKRWWAPAVPGWATAWSCWTASAASRSRRPTPCRRSDGSESAST